MNKLALTITLVLSMATLSTGVQAVGFGGLGKKKEATSTDVGSLVEQQSGIVENLVAGFTEYTAGQAQVARALGLKEEAEKLESEQEALASGNVKDKDGIDRTIKLTNEAQRAINKKLAEGVTLSAEAKKEFSKALPSYARGTLNTVKLLPEVKKWGASASKAVKGAGMMGAVKLKKKLSTGMFIVSKLPGYLKSAKDSYASLLAFSKKNNIDTSNAEDLLGDDF